MSKKIQKYDSSGKPIKKSNSNEPTPEQIAQFNRSMQDTFMDIHYGSKRPPKGLFPKFDREVRHYYQENENIEKTDYVEGVVIDEMTSSRKSTNDGIDHGGSPVSFTESGGCAEKMGLVIVVVLSLLLLLVVYLAFTEVMAIILR